MSLTFFVRPGKPCEIRKREQTEWTPYRTTKRLTFQKAQVWAPTGQTIFATGEWELRIAGEHVMTLETNPQRLDKLPRYSTFNKGIMGRNGKGANRRRGSTLPRNYR